MADSETNTERKPEKKLINNRMFLKMFFVFFYFKIKRYKRRLTSASKSMENKNRRLNKMFSIH